MYRRSFEAVAGREHDYWMTRIVGMPVVPIGRTLAAGMRRRGPPDEVVGLAATSAAGLRAIEAHYAAKRRISLICMFDACIEALFVRWVAIA